MEKNKAEELIEKYVNGTCTQEEKAVVEADFLLDFKAGYEDIAPEKVEAAFERIKLALPTDKQTAGLRYKLRPILAIAATLILIAGIALYYFQSPNVSAIAERYKNDVKPGRQAATLILGNGKRINLGTALNGELANESGIRITKASDGHLIYQAQPTQNSTAQVTYNTITTPRGGEYQLILPDGTVVWLNASSALTFPTRFEGKKRTVQCSGEAYFEVAKNKEKPFTVQTGAQEVEVLGTHFNINGYEGEPSIKTTLLEGIVAVSNVSNNQRQVLKPGDQSVLKSQSMEVRQVNPETVVAWKDGKFKFVNENIKPLMRKLARWYNIEVVYEGQMTNKDFSGSVSRYDNISRILDILEATNTVHFKIEGRRITVMP